MKNRSFVNEQHASIKKMKELQYKWVQEFQPSKVMMKTISGVPESTEEDIEIVMQINCSAARSIEHLTIKS